MKYLFLYSLFFVLACSTTVKRTQDKLVHNPSVHFFDFDEVIHYSIVLESNYYMDLENREALPIIEKQKYSIVYGNVLEDLVDTSFLNSMVEMGFSKYSLSNRKFARLNQILSEVEVEEMSVTECIPIYRDILVFKKQGKIIGLAKICFECRKSKIVGTDKNTFGFEDRLITLEKLIK